MIESPYIIFEMFDANMDPLTVDLKHNLTFHNNGVNLAAGSYNLTRDLFQV